MLWLYFIGLFPISLLLVLWFYERRQRQSSDRQSRPTARTILLVDDDQTVCRLTGQQLERYGYQVLAARDAETALTLAKTHPGHIDLVIADVIMPGMSGPELAACIRANLPLTPVIFISGLAEETGIRYSGSPKMAFVGKPFNFDRLRHTVEDVLEEAHSS